MIQFSCPKCQTKLQAPTYTPGATVVCSNCSTQIRVPSPGKEVLEQAGRTTKSIGQFASDIVRPQGSDDYSRGAAIFLREEYFGGRTRIGTPLSTMQGPLFYAGAAIFSWPYLIAFLQSTTSAWEFLPFSRTELVRIQLSQKILWMRVLPIYAIWMVCMTITLIAGIVLTFATVILGLPILLIGCVLSNLAAAQLLKGIANSLHRSQITLRYGFPTKHQLLAGVSDAPVEEQLDGVLQLCQALAKCQFGRWDQFSSHGSRDGVVGATFDRVTQLLNRG